MPTMRDLAAQQGAAAKLGKPASDLAAGLAAMSKAMERMGTAVGAAFRRFARANAPVLVVDDPGHRRPDTFRQALSQMRDVVKHEFWMAADRPERSPGARWVVPRRRTAR